MADATLRLVVQVYDHNAMPQGSARIELTTEQLRLVQSTTDTKNLAQWAAEELTSIINCLEDFSK